jgi:hypothetical protein
MSRYTRVDEKNTTGIYVEMHGNGMELSSFYVFLE